MKLSRQRKLISRACLMAAASLLAAVPTVRAANIFFDPNGGTTAAVTAQTIGTGGTANWDTTLNYWINAGTGTTIPGNVVGAAYTFNNADTAYFIGQSGTVTGSANVTASGGATGQKVITTTSTTGLSVGMTVTGTGIPAGATITAITANANFTISANLTATAAGTVTAAQHVTLNGLYDSTQGMTIAGAQTLTLAGSTPTITNTGSAVTTISANVAGTAGFTKAGTGILALSGTNTISGNIKLQQGVISLNSAAALGTLGSLTIGGSGYAVGLDGAGTTLTSTGGITIGSDFTFIGTNSLNTGTGAVGLAANRTVQVGMNAQTTGALTIGGIISGAGALTKTGPGALTLSGANSFTGGTILNAGSLTLSGANTTSGATSVNGGLLFLGNAAALGTGALNLNGGLIDAVTAAQTLTSTGAINITGDFVYGGNLSLTTAAGANIVVSANSTIKTYGTGATTSLTLGGVISGTGFGLTKTGTGALVAANANTFNGGVNLVDGRLTVGNGAALGTGALTFAGGTLNASAAGLTLANALTLSADANFLGTNALTLSGNASLGAGNRAVNGAASTLTLSGVVSGNAFTKTGLGTVVLSGTNTYTGGTTVREGTLTAGNAAAFGTGAILVTSTGTLDLTTQTIANTVNLFGGTLAATGGSTNLSASLVGAGSFGTITAILSGSGTLAQSSWLTPLNANSSLTLTAANTFTDGTNLSAGTLVLSNNTALGTGALTATGGLLNVTTSLTIANATTISGAVGFTGSAPLKTSGTVNLSGATSLFSAAGVVSSTATGGAVGTAIITTASTAGLVVGQTVSGTGIPAGSVITAITTNASYTISNNLTAVAAGTVSAYNALTINGIVSGSNVLTLNGPGLTVLGGANTNSAGVVVASGITRLTNAAGLGTAAATVKGNSTAAGTLDIGGKAVTNALTFTGGTLTDTTGGDGSVTGNVLVDNLIASTAFSAKLSGTATLTKNNVGSLALNGFTNFSGGTIINGGDVTAGANQAIGTGAVTINLGSLNLGGNTAPNTFNLAGGTLAASGATNLPVTQIGANSFGVISGILSGTGSLTVNTPNLLTLSGANTFTGTSNVLTAGTLNLNNAAALGAATASWTLNGGSLDNTSAAAITTGANPLTLGGNVGFTGTQSLNLAGTVALTANRSLSVLQNTLTLSGIVSGNTFALTKNGFGNLTLSAANTYTGGTVINAGVATAGNAASFGTGSITVNGINNQVTNVFSGGTVNNGSSGMGGTLDLAALTPTNSIILAGGALVGSAINPTNVSGYGFIQGGMTGAGVLTVNTTGALTIYGGQAFTGGTTLTAGTLNLMNAGSMGTGTFNWNGGTLDNTTTGWVSPTNAFTLGGNVTAQGTVGMTMNGATTVAVARTVTVNANGIWFGGAVTLTGALTKSGPGILGLNGVANSGAGGINVLAGTLYTDTTVTTAPSFGTGPVAISAGANVVINSKPASDLAFANDFSGAGNLYVSPMAGGTSTRTLSGNLSAFTGFLSVGAANGNGKVVLPTTLNSAALVRLESGATIYQPSGTFANTFQLSGGSTGEAYGQIRTEGAAFTGPLILLANSSIGAASSGGTFSGPVIGNFALNRQGGSTVTVSGNNTFTGGLTISGAGTTSFGNANAAGSGTLNLSVTGAVGSVGANLATFNLGGLAGVTGATFSNNSTVASLTATGGLSGTNRVFVSSFDAAAVGQPINGTGILAGTRIASIVNSTPSLAALGGDSGSNYVFASATTGFLVGMPVTGTGVASGAKVTAFVAAPTVSSIVGESGSSLVFATATTGLQVGMPVVGTGVATGAKVTALAAAPTISSIVGDSGSSLVFASATTGLQVGMPVVGTGVATGAKVTALAAAPTVSSIVGDSGSSLVFASATTGLVVGMPVAGTGVATGAKVTALAAAPTLAIDPAGALTGATDVPVVSTVGLQVGMPVAGAALSAGTKITAIVGNVVTLSSATIADLTGADTLVGSAYATLSVANTGAASGNLAGSAYATLSAVNTGAASGNLAGTAYATLSAANTGAASGDLAGTGYATLSVANTGAVSGSIAGSAYVTLSGNLTADAAGVATVSGNVAVGTNNANTTFAGVISGAGTFTKVGTGTLTLQGLNTFTGGLELNAGGVTLDFTTNASNILASTGSVNLNGGTLTLLGKSAATDTQTITGAGLLTVAAGGSKVVFNQNSATGLLLSVGNLARNTGATLDISQTGTPSAANGLVISNANVNGILGAWATVGGTDWAVANTGSGVSGFAAYTTFVTDGSNLSTNNSLLTDGAITTSVAGLSANSLKITTTQSSQVFDLGGQQLTLNTGGLLFVGADSYVLRSLTAGASLTPYATQELIVQQAGAGVLTLNVPVVDNSAAVSLIKAGTGELVLGGVNTFTGNVFINGGTLTIAAESALGAVPSANSAANVSIFGATLKTTADVSLDAKRGLVVGGNGATFAPTNSTLTVTGPVSGAGSVTLAGSANGKLVLGAANTYTGVTTVTNGTLVLGNSAALGTSGSLTVSGGGVGFGAGVTTLSLTKLGTTGGTITLSTTDATPAAVALSVNAAAGVPTTFAGNFAGLGSLALSGNGSVFTLSGANTLAGGISVAANSGLNVNSAGALGTGTLSLGAGSAVLGFTTTIESRPDLGR